jgi:hypothetical protein
MGANRTSFLANRRLQPLGHLSGADVASIKEEPLEPLKTLRVPSLFRRQPCVAGRIGFPLPKAIRPTAPFAASQ